MSKRSIYLASVILAVLVACNASADLLGYWSLDENAGTIAADSSGNGHDGTVIGAEWTGGILGSALDFDGVDDYVLCAERAGNGPGVYPEQLMPQTSTVACWTKLDNFAYFSSFVGNGIDTGDDECGFFLYNWGWVDENEQDFGLAIRTETGMSYVETPNIYETNTWYHLAASYDGTDVRIYVDGSLAAGPTNVGGPLRTTTSMKSAMPRAGLPREQPRSSPPAHLNPKRPTTGAWMNLMPLTLTEGMSGASRSRNRAAVSKESTSRE